MVDYLIKSLQSNLEGDENKIQRTVVSRALRKFERKKMNKVRDKSLDRVRVNALHMPPFALEGSDVTLTCHYHMASLRLYSLKWYFNDREIFRYIPSERPSLVALPADAVTVEVSKSA